GGRCNVTHACNNPRVLTSHYPRGEKNLIGPFHRWTVRDTVEWFESRGVPLKTESDGRMFPKTDRSETIVHCLQRTAEELGVDIRLKTEVHTLEKANDTSWQIALADGAEISAKFVLLATGGIRNGAGVRLAGALGHDMVPAAPSLFTFKTSNPLIQDLAGISVRDAGVRIEGLPWRSRGPCLITHWGLSGPGILRLSSLAARELAERDYHFDCQVNWCGEAGREEIESQLQAARERHPKKRVRSGTKDWILPSRLWQRMVRLAKVDEETTWANLPREERRQLAEILVASRFEVRGKTMNKEEFVTAGGIALSEVDFKTMESRRCPGLYFAGEVLDIDGITGGFNFQAAWTTSLLAGRAASGIE
ncbi:MAG: aminoacetone oxidase family FAD-binding enzyme, partial [Verrucomicrobiota bacterium]